MSESEQLARIEAKLDLLINPPPPPPPPPKPPSPTVEISEAMRLTNTHSLSAVYRRLKQLGIKPYAPGKYYREAFNGAFCRSEIQELIKNESRISHRPRL